MSTASLNHATTFDVRKIRAQFPALNQRVYDKPLIYLDNAATSQKPAAVIDAIQNYYRTYNANVHRGLHRLSELATEAYEDARRKVAKFINAPDSRQIIFTRGTTESINLVANSYGGLTLKSGDQVLITHMEHHSNIVPWQLICERTGAQLKVAPIADDGSLIVPEFEKLLTNRTKIVAVTHISNALGTINPVKQLTQAAHAVGAVVLIDGAQATPHGPVDVADIGCDFYAFSGHKTFGPTGIGVLFGKFDLLSRMPPYQGGGEMIESVKFEKTTFREPPMRFEAGTPHISGAIGLGAAIDWINSLDWPAAITHEADVLAYGTAKIQQIDGLKLVGAAPHKAAVLAFTLLGIAPYDISPVLDHHGVAIRVGHHCAQPVMDRFGIPATVRASIALYNTRDDIDVLCAALDKVKRIFAYDESPGMAIPGLSESNMTTAKLDLTPDQLVENFEFLGDWEQRFTYLIDLGRKLPPFPQDQMIEKNLVPGCQAQVWMIHEMQLTNSPAIRLNAVSDAHLVNGLIAILLSLYDAKSPQQILKIDAEGLFTKLELDEHLSPTRRNGLHSMVNRIREIAAAHAP